MGAKKTSETTSNATQTAAPPSWTMPGISDLAGRVNKVVAAGPPPAYAGDFTAQMNPTRVADQVAAYDDASATAGRMGTFANDQLHQFFTPRDDQGALHTAVMAAIDPVFRQLREQVLPGITNSALQAGAYSNDRALGVVPEQAIRDASGEAARVAGTLGYQGYQAEQDRQIQRMSQLPQLSNLVAQMAATKGDVMGVGTTLDQQLRQQAIDNQQQKHDYQVRQPYEGMDIAAQLLAALSGNYGTQTRNGTEKTVQQTSGLGPILQGVMGAASLAGSLGAFGPLGAAAKVAAPAASSFFNRGGN